MGQDGRADFDFLFGKWNGHQRRLRERLNHCTEWEEFESTLVARPILGGLGNIDEVTMHRESGVAQGFTLRLYDTTTQEWSLYWASGGSSSIVPPTIGKFVNGIGEFYDHELIAGKHIFVRYLWTVISPDACHWEQAFSEDGGKTWETNWINEFTRQT